MEKQRQIGLLKYDYDKLIFFIARNGYYNLRITLPFRKKKKKFAKTDKCLRLVLRLSR